MSTVPAERAGAMAVSEVGEVTLTFVAGVGPKRTIGVPVKLAPATVTTPPPESGPVLALTPVTTG
jgi:hypothetical protein